MKEKQIGDITVNNGKGFYDNEGLCDTLINDCNNLVKSLFSGRYVQFCAVIVQMIQKLTNLKKGIASDMDSMKEKIEDLKRVNSSLLNQLNRKDGAEDGEN